MKYRLKKGKLNDEQISEFNKTREHLGLKATGDVLEVDYSEGGKPGPFTRYVVYIGGTYTPPGYVRDVGDAYDVKIFGKRGKISKNRVKVLERAPQ